MHPRTNIKASGLFGYASIGVYWRFLYICIRFIKFLSAGQYVLKALDDSTLVLQKKKMFVTVY